MLIEQILNLSPLRLVTVSPQTSITAAARRMAHFHVGFAAVMDEDDELVGVFSERDIVNRLGSIEGDIDDIAVGDWMTPAVVTISPKDSVIEAITAMNAHGIRHLVAAEGDRPVGVISIRDVLRVFAREVLDEDADGKLVLDYARALAA